MVSAVRCWLLKPTQARLFCNCDGRLIKPDGCAGAVSERLAMFLTNSPPPKTRARAKENRHERPFVYYVIEIIWLNLVFLSSRLDAVPAIPTLVTFGHIHILRPLLWTLTNSGNIYIYIRHIYIHQIANICIYSCDNIGRCIYTSSTRLRPHKRTPSR